MVLGYNLLLFVSNLSNFLQWNPQADIKIFNGINVNAFPLHQLIDNKGRDLFLPEETNKIIPHLLMLLVVCSRGKKLIYLFPESPHALLTVWNVLKKRGQNLHVGTAFYYC